VIVITCGRCNLQTDRAVAAGMEQPACEHCGAMVDLGAARTIQPREVDDSWRCIRCGLYRHACKCNTGIGEP